MDIQNIYEDVRPYLSDPKIILDFILKHRDDSLDEFISEINRIISESEGSLKTDLRILLNALLKQK